MCFRFSVSKMCFAGRRCVPTKGGIRTKPEEHTVPIRKQEISDFVAFLLVFASENLDFFRPFLRQGKKWTKEK